MGFISFLFGKSPEKCEQKADAYVKNGAYGPAKIEYETALELLEKKQVFKPDYKTSLEKKLHHSMENLALEHKQTARELIESGCVEDARDLLHLALELTRDDTRKAEIQSMIDGIHTDRHEPDDMPLIYADMQTEHTDEPYDPDSDDDYFTALCSALPEAEYEAYLSYGEAFKNGYIALNRGDFETAVTQLSEAIKDNPDPGTHIHLELATAHLNRGDFPSARSFLDDFLKQHPESLKACHLMCEILWESGEFETAHQFLRSCPPEVSDAVQFQVLQGETLIREGKLQEAVNFYREQLQTRGWEETIARSLAAACESLGLTEEARDLYGQLIGACQGCGRRIDPFIKQRFAETKFITGDRSTAILELYLSLADDDPANRSVYYEKISSIYSSQGNEIEARRFLSFARKLAPNEQGT